MQYLMIQLDDNGGTVDEMELQNEECRRVLTHLLNMQRIWEKPDAPGAASPDDPPGFRLVLGEGALLSRFDRPPPPENVRHLLRETNPEGEAGELPISPMEYRLLRQMILTSRELAQSKRK